MSAYWRLRIRDASDSADALVISSVSGGVNPYVVLPPTGDGQTLDPLGGAFTVAAYQIRVIDASVAGARVVTDQMADSAGRTQLLSRRAYIATSADGSAWDVLVPGWVNQIRQTSATTYEVTVGETRRLEQTRQIFQKAETGTGYDFSRVTMLIGGPIVGGSWGPIADVPRTRWQVSAVTVDMVTLALVSAYLYDETQGIFRLYTGGFPETELGILNKRATQWFERLSTPLGTPPLESQGWFPSIAVDVYTKGTTSPVDTYTPLSASQPIGGISRNIGYDKLLGQGTTLRLDWTTSQPTVGTRFDLDIYPTTIGPDNPVHWEGHPVDFAAACFAAAGATVDATSIATVTAALGADLWYRFRGTAAVTVGPFVEGECFGPFGFAPRIKADGSYEFITTRLRPASAPAETIDTSVMVDAAPVPYDADAKTQVNWVIWKQHNYTNWTAPSQGERPADFCLVQPQTYQPDAEDAELATELAAYGQHEVKYDLSGGLSVPSLGISQVGQIFQHILDNIRFVQATHRQIYDWYGRGRDATEAAVYSGAIAATIGDFVTVQIPWKPGADAAQSPTMQRNTARVMQVVQKTRGAGRDLFKLLDAGGITQVGLVPTFTIAASSARPRNVATVTLTNGAALVAAGVQQVRVEYALGASPTSGTLVGNMTPGVDTTLDVPAAPSGSVVSARMRGESKSQAPTAYTAFQSVTLDSLPTPTALTAGAGADDTETLLTWAVSDSSLALVVRWKLSTETIYGNVQTLPAGSVQYVIRFLTPGESYDAEVSTLETAPYVGESTPATVSFTQGGTVPTLNPPTAPAVFAGTPIAGGGSIVDGSYGLEVTATEFPSTVVVEVAVETAIGSGTYGSYTTLGQTEAVAGGRTRVTAFAPNDGLLRSLRAYQHREGATDSSTTTPLSVDPWSVVAPPVLADGAVVLAAADPTIPSGRVLTGGTGVIVTDGGAGSTITVDAAVALDDLTDVDPTGKADGDVVTWDATANKYVPLAPTGGGTPPRIVAIADGGTAPLTVGLKCAIRVPAGTPAAWFVDLPVSGSITFGVKAAATLAGLTSITGGSDPAVALATAATSASLGGWTAPSADDLLEIEVTAVDGVIAKATLTLVYS